MIISNPYLDMKKIANSGQIFRFNNISDREYELVAKDKYLYIKSMDKENNEYLFECSKDEYENFWEDYFDLKEDYESFSTNIPKEDEFLTKASEYSKGIRILKQDKWEMLISFIISQRKSIPAIKSSIEKLCKYFGKKISKEIYSFPDIDSLANASIKELEACSLGYRSEYIKETAKIINDNNDILDNMSKLSDEELIRELCKFKGVGIKVANCVALFAYHRIKAFPIDVWIQKMIDKHYNGKFPIERYEAYAGVIQQYIFFYGREVDKGI